MGIITAPSPISPASSPACPALRADHFLTGLGLDLGSRRREDAICASPKPGPKSLRYGGNKARYMYHTALTLGFRLEANGVSLVYATDHEPFVRQLASGEGKIMCASGAIVINLRGLEYLQAVAGEDETTAWRRLRSKLPIHGQAPGRSLPPEAGRGPAPGGSSGQPPRHRQDRRLGDLPRRSRSQVQAHQRQAAPLLEARPRGGGIFGGPSSSAERMIQAVPAMASVRDRTAQTGDEDELIWPNWGDPQFSRPVLSRLASAICVCVALRQLIFTLL